MEKTLKIKNKIKALLAICISLSMILIYYTTKEVVEPIKNKGQLYTKEDHQSFPTANKSKTQPEQIELNCDEYFQPPEYSDKWKKSKYSLIKSLFNTLELDNFTLDLIAIDSGIGLYEGRKLQKSYRGNYKKPAYTENEAYFATSKEEKLVQDFISGHNYLNLAEALSNGSLRGNAYYPGKSGTLFLLSYLLKAEPEDKRHMLLDQLIDIGIEVTYSDLVLMTKLGISKVMVEKAFLSSDLQANIILKRFGHYSSLALIALESKNAKLAHYWISIGSIVRPDRFSINALDLLAIHGAGFIQEDTDNIFSQIAQQGIHPSLATSYLKLKKLVSAAIFKDYDEYMQTTGIKLTKNQFSQANSVVHKIHANVLSDVFYVQSKNKAKNKCFTILAKQATKIAMQFKHKSKIKKRIIANKINDDSAESLILEAENLFTTNYDIEAYLGKEHNLRSKQIVMQYKLHELKKIADKIEQQEKPEDLDMQEILSEVKRLAKNSQWNDAINLLKQYNISNEETLTSLLFLAINANASIDIIDELLAKGGQLLPYTISQLIGKNNVVLAEHLIPFGLDIHYVDIIGYSPLAQSVKLNSYEMAKWLLLKGIRKDNSSFGFDALDIALQQFNLKINRLKYIDLLISSGMTIELSHRQIVKGIQNTNFDAYLTIVGAYPDLIL